MLWPALSLILLVSTVGLTDQSPGAGARAIACPEPELVDLAVRRAVEYLVSRQEPDGEWISREDESRFPMRLTALTAYALRTAGVPAGNLRLQRAAEKLKDRSELLSISTRSLSLLLWCATDPVKYAQRLEEDAQFLVTQQHQEGAWGQSLRAGPNPDKHWQDQSNTQLALLALWQASQHGFDVPRGIWTRAEKNLVESQNADGGWGYALRDESDIPAELRLSYGTMTAAGVASVELIVDRLYAAEELTYNGRLAAKCGQPPAKSAALRGAADRAVAWLSAQFALRMIAGAPPRPEVDGRVDARETLTGFYQWQLARAGLARGAERFDEHRWSCDLLTHLVASQQEDGSWGDTENTAWALLSMVAARTPVIVAKMRFGSGDDWNNDPRDAAGLVRWYSIDVQAPLAWETLGFDDLATWRPSPPVLMLSGHDAPRLTGEQLAKLRTHVRSGGTILGVACCSRGEFAEGLQTALGSVLPELTAAPLPPDHAIWGIDAALEPGEDVIGMAYGCRTPVFVLTRGQCCAWQQNASASHPRAFELAGNILRYATYLRSPAPRGDRHRTTPRAESLRIATMAMLTHGGDWSCDAEAAIARADADLTRRMGLGVRQLAADGSHATGGARPDLIWCNSHTFAPPSDEATARLREYFAAGGTLLATACCGSQAFGPAFQGWATSLVPGGSWKPIPADDALITGAGLPLGSSLANPAIKQPRGQISAVRLDAPVLYGIEHRGRWAIVFSTYDIACGICDHPCYGCVGYERTEGLALLSNMLQHAGGGRPAREPSASSP